MKRHKKRHEASFEKNKECATAFMAPDTKNNAAPAPHLSKKLGGRASSLSCFEKTPLASFTHTRYMHDLHNLYHMALLEENVALAFKIKEAQVKFHHMYQKSLKDIDMEALSEEVIDQLLDVATQKAFDAKGKQVT